MENLEDEQNKILNLFEVFCACGSYDEEATEEIKKFIDKNAPLASGRLGDMAFVHHVNIDRQERVCVTIMRQHTNPFHPIEVYTHSFYLPSNLVCEKIEVDYYTIKFETDQGIVVSNFREMKKKLIEVGQPFSEEEVVSRFSSLCNEEIVLETKFKTYPDKIEDDFLGILMHDGSGGYNGFLDYRGNLVELYLFFHQAESKDFKLEIEKMKRLVESDKFDIAFEKMIPDRLELKNEYWLIDDEKEVSEDEFRKQLRITHINLEDDGTSSLTYFANDLFLGHDIMIYLDENGEYDHCSL